MNIVEVNSNGDHIDTITRMEGRKEVLSNDRETSEQELVNFSREEKTSHISNTRRAADDLGLPNAAETLTVIDIQQSPDPVKYQKVSILPLVFLIFFEVCGGPFGAEDTVRAAGPLLALVGFLVVPLIWSVPEALITAELSTMFPENGGFVVWVSTALGPYWGFQQGWMKWLSGVIDNALYPVLFLDYLKLVLPVFSHGYPRTLAIILLTAGLTYMSYRGLTIVGWTAVFLGVASMLPFVVMGLISIPKLAPSRWLVVNVHKIKWSLYFNTLFWNLHYWDSISTVVGEVQNPKKTLPKALLYAMIIVVCSYFFPLLAATGAVPLDRDSWTDGYLADVARAIGGSWLCWCVQGAAALSSMGMFLAEMSSDSFQLLGMGDRGMLPEIFSRRSCHGTPVLGILLSASGVILLSWLEFDDIIAAENFLYCFGMFLEILAFLVLRIKHPDLNRPYKISLGNVGSILMCIPPIVLMCVVLAFSSLKVLAVSLIAMVSGLVLQPGMMYIKKKKWVKFSTSASLPDLRFQVHVGKNTELLTP